MPALSLSCRARLARFNCNWHLQRLLVAVMPGKLQTATAHTWPMPSLPLEGIRMELFGDDSGVDALHWSSHSHVHDNKTPNLQEALRALRMPIEALEDCGPRQWPVQRPRVQIYVQEKRMRRELMGWGTTLPKLSVATPVGPTEQHQKRQNKASPAFPASGYQRSSNRPVNLCTTGCARGMHRSVAAKRAIPTMSALPSMLRPWTACPP